MPRTGTETDKLVNRKNIRNINLEMRSPGRGRKQGYPDCKQTGEIVFGNEMPRKGTETNANKCFI